MPLTAAVMNLLAAAATFGLIVAVFRRGWGADLLDVGTGPVEAFLPVFLLAILFGLSMDYQVFLVSRMPPVRRATPPKTPDAMATPPTEGLITGQRGG